MRPLRGVVTAVGWVLTIQLESGQLLKIPNRHGYGVGDEIHIGYSFTNKKPTTVLDNIIPHGDRFEGHGHEPKIDSEDGKYYDEDHLVVVGSGALSPVGVVEDSGVVLEFSDGVLISGRMRWPHELT